MENSINLVIDEEPIIFNPSNFSNLGVHSKKIKTPRNIYMSFSPNSSNRTITFTNTIMYPTITTETTNDTEKNNSHFENERYKSKKDATRMKTESSKDEKNNNSYEKQILNILIENEEDSSNIIDESNKDLKNPKDSMEINPFYLGGKSSFEMNKFSFNNNIDFEMKKVNLILNREKNTNSITNTDEGNNSCKTFQNVGNKERGSNNNSKSKFKRRNKRTGTLNVTKSKNSPVKEAIKKSLRKSMVKNKAPHLGENQLLNNKNSQKSHKGENDLLLKSSFRKSLLKKRQLTIMANSPKYKLNDNNIKSFKKDHFNINSSKFKVKIIPDSSQEKIGGTTKHSQEKKRRLKYIGVSENKLNTKFNIDTPKVKKEEMKFSKKKENFTTKMRLSHILPKDPNENKININAKNKRPSKNLLYKFQKLRTFQYDIDLNEKKKITSPTKKKSLETKKNVDFESALKNKNNLAKTQFNLFSPDKFTNTQFCGSDYCEYTLDCMELILNKKKSERQIKNKINFNFPKSPKNKGKKKIALFDLDETLVHCTGDINTNKEPYQHCIKICLPGNKEVSVGINIRPHWKKTMNLIKKQYYIVVFTASHQAYADAVLDFMDPNKKYFKYRLYRNNCSLVDVDGAKFYVKDLDIFDEHYNLKDIVIIDNSVLSFIYHLENGIPIVPYYNEDKDGSLYVVGLYLSHIHKENDLREANKKYINLDSFVKEAKERNEENNTINEESLSIENSNNNNINLINNNSDINNNNKQNNSNKSNNTPKEKNDIPEKDSSKRRKSSCFSYKTANSQQNKLISQSKLITMYYSLNDQCIANCNTTSIINNKSSKDLTTDEEKDNESNKDDIDLCSRKRKLTLDEDIHKEKIKHKSSSKTCKNYLDLKLVRSNFYNSFSP